MVVDAAVVLVVVDFVVVVVNVTVLVGVDFVVVVVIDVVRAVLGLIVDGLNSTVNVSAAVVFSAGDVAFFVDCAAVVVVDLVCVAFCRMLARNASKGLNTPFDEDPASSCCPNRKTPSGSTYVSGPESTSVVAIERSS